MAVEFLQDGHAAQHKLHAALPQQQASWNWNIVNFKRKGDYIADHANYMYKAEVAKRKPDVL